MKGFVVENFLDDKQSYYSFIIAVSKIARIIVKEANDVGDVGPDDPVEQACDRLKNGDYEIIIPTVT